MGRKLDHARGLYLDGIRDGHPREAVAEHTGARYTQHSTGVKDGRAGFVEFFEDFLQRNPDRHIEILRGFEDGQYVFVHAFQSLNDGQARWVTMDFFDTDDDDLIIEHWDVIAPFAPVTPSGHTSTGGTTAATDLDLTEENKALVRSMIESLLMPSDDPADPADFIAEDYVQHNADVVDGLEAFRHRLQQRPRARWYDEIVLLVGSGSMVATLCRVRRQGQEYAQADLFRVEGGRIAEHWDAAEPVPPRDEWANSGKF